MDYFDQIFNGCGISPLSGLKSALESTPSPKKKISITVRDGMINAKELAAAFDELAKMADRSRVSTADEARIVARTYRVAADRIRNLAGE